MLKLNHCVMLSACVLLIATSGCDKNKGATNTPVVKPNLEFYGLSSSNALVKYNANAPETAISTVSITGLQTAEQLVAIDFRPATGQLYGVTNQSRVYFINHLTGLAKSPAGTQFTPSISGNVVGFDFNPTVDRIRLVTSTGQNFRLHPETGAVAAIDGNLNPGTPRISGSAYTNSIAGSTATMLYNIDLASNKLLKQDPPNDGTLVEVGALGITATAGAGFDISPDNSVALATLTTGNTNGLYQIDINTGKATMLGNISTTVIGIAIPAKPVAYATTPANNLLIFNLSTPGTPVSKLITGLQSGETMVGIDMRPATGQLYGLGSTGRLYTLNMSSGAVTVVGSTPAALLGTSFGFDFNPTVDRIRVVSNTGQNLRLNPIDGTLSATDGLLNPGTPTVAAAAYTNNFSGATTTVLYTIDFTTDKLYMQNPPNNGTLVEVGALGVNVESNSGFDIGGTSGISYGSFTVGTSTKLYTVNLTTGAATAFADLPIATNSFAVGLGF